MDDLRSLLDGFEPPTRAAWEALRDAQLKGRPYADLVHPTEDGPGLPPLVRDVPPAAPFPLGRSGPLLAGARVLETSTPEIGDGARALEAGFEHLLVVVLPDDEFDDGRDVDYAPVLDALPRAQLSLETASPLDTHHALAHVTKAKIGVRVVPDLFEYGDDLRAWLASPAQELALLLAHGAWMLRGCPDPSRFAHPGRVRVTASAQRIARNVGLSVNVGARVVEQVAKLRALRLVWAKLLGAFDVTGGAARAFVVASPTPDELTECDPETNRIRTSLQLFAAVAGGADVVLPVEHDGPRNAFHEDAPQRLALNQLRLLRDESFLQQVDDPFAGAHVVERLTDGLARRAWELFQRIEAAGGFGDAFMDGVIEDVIGVPETLAARRERVRTRERVIVGVSRFADPPVEIAAPDDEDFEDDDDAFDEDEDEDEDDLLDAPEPDERPDDAEPVITIPYALTDLPLADRAAVPFETLHELTQALAEARERPLTALLLPLGPVGWRRARADFAADLFRGGGFHVVDPHGLDDVAAAAASVAEHAPDVAVVCGADDDYASLVPALLDALPDDVPLYVAGAPRADLAGLPVAGFVHLGCDALAVLAGALDPFVEVEA